MDIGAWYNSKLKNLKWTDIGFLKISVAAFTLMAAKLWAPLLSFEWYWYGLVGVLACVMVFRKVFGK